MKKNKIILALASSVILASCGAGKPLTYEEAKNVASEIIKKTESKDFKGPSKLTGEMVAKDKNNDATMKFVTDADKQYFYLKVEGTQKSELTGQTVTSSIETWNYKDADKYISATSLSSSGLSLKTYTEEKSWSAEYTSEAFSDVSNEFLKMLVNSKTEKEFVSGSGVDGLETLTYKSNGKDNLLIEGGNDNAAIHITIEKNLLTLLEIKTKDEYESYKISYGKAEINKPDLSGFMKA